MIYILSIDITAYWSRSLAVSAAALSFGLLSTSTLAANHLISAETTAFDCSTVNPGDTITLTAGPREPLKISNCVGTYESPIVIRNDVTGIGPTIIRRTSGSDGGFIFHCKNCIWTEIDGSGKWIGAPAGKTYGIRVTISGGGSPGAFVKVSDKSRFLTLRNIEVDGKWPAITTNGLGIDVNDHDEKAASNPGIWREGILIENCYVHDVEGEGMYIGANWFQGALPLRNIVIRENLVEDTGWNGINLKSSIAGVNEIANNVVRRAGKRIDTSKGQHSAIAVYEGFANVTGNWVEDAGEAGIRQYVENIPISYGQQTFEVYNNVVLNPGRTGPLPGYGIVSNSAVGVAPTSPRIYNNTIIGAKDSGIRIGSNTQGAYVRNNIVVDGVGLAITAPSTTLVSNNFTGSMAMARFVDAAGGNFRLSATSPARNAVTGGFPSDDYDGIARPQDGVADQGAFESVIIGNPPLPPSSIIVK